MTNSHHRTLAAGGLFRIRQCSGCRRVLTLEAGPVSLRFDRDALTQLKELIAEAMRTLDEDVREAELQLGFSRLRGQA